MEPESFAGAGLTETLVESLVLKFLLARGDGTGREIADQVKLPFILVDELLRTMKNDQLVGHKGAAAMNDFQYLLADLGRERARRLCRRTAPTSARPPSRSTDYVASVKAQTLAGQQPKAEHLAEAFADLLLNQRMLDRLGPAINSGRGLFLYGAPGNGKTSIAERVTARLRPGHLDSPRHRRRRRDHPPLRPRQPRGVAPGSLPGRLRPAEDRQALGPHPRGPRWSPAAS